MAKAEKSAHHEDINAAMNSYSEQAVAWFNLDWDEESADEIASDFWDSILEVQVWRKDGSSEGTERVEFLLAVGGPTVSVHVDLGRDFVQFFHSWGWNETVGREQTETRPGSGGFRHAAWVDAAEAVSQR